MILMILPNISCFSFRINVLCAGVMDSECIESVPISVYALNIIIIDFFFIHIGFDCIISI